MLAAYAICFGLSLGLSLALTALMRVLAPRLGLLDHPSERKIHTSAVPLGGGIAMALSAMLTFAIAGAGVFVIHRSPGLFHMPEDFLIHVPGLMESGVKLIPMLLGAAFMATMGIIDDIRGLAAWHKLAAQVAVGVVLVLSGFTITLFIQVRVVSWVLTVAWIVFVTNSFNLLDNMDGLSGGVAFIIAAVFMAVAVTTGQLFVALFLSVVLGAVLGFLVFNFPPARIFMGDSGSYLLGYLLGSAAVAFTFAPVGTEEVSLLPFLLPFLLFAIPAYDTFSVVMIRLREGRHPFDADKRHFSHRLVDLGLSRREAVLTVYTATLVTAFPALYLYELPAWAMVGALLQALLVLSLIGLLEHAGARKISR